MRWTSHNGAARSDCSGFTGQPDIGLQIAAQTTVYTWITVKVKAGTASEPSKVDRELIVTCWHGRRSITLSGHMWSQLGCDDQVIRLSEGVKMRLNLSQYFSVCVFSQLIRGSVFRVWPTEFGNIALTKVSKKKVLYTPRKAWMSIFWALGE